MKGCLGILWFACCMLQLNGQNCTRPFSIRYPAIGLDSIEIRWSDNNGMDVLGYQVAYVLRSAPFSAATFSDTLTSRVHIIRGLASSTQYNCYVRTICSSTKASEWNGPFPFTTLLSNPTDCETLLTLQDDNCDLGGESFSILIDEEGLLGQTIFLTSVDLILQHSWLADLEINIENPAGKITTLTKFAGAAQDNFGVYDVACDTFTRFALGACTPIAEGVAPYRGEYDPVTSLSALNDGSNSKGLWKLNVCDRSNEDKGTLRHLKINFSKQLCEPIVDYYISKIEGTNITVNWVPPINCDGMRLEYGPVGFLPGQGDLIQLACQKKKETIVGLLPDTQYEVYLQSECLGEKASPSCRTIFRTACANPTQRITIDDQVLCLPSCPTPCLLNGPIFNTTNDDIDWIVWQGATDSDNTGPTADLNRTGKYLYIEASPEICDSFQSAIVETTCVYLGDSTECGMSFYQHKVGSDQGKLAVDISRDGGSTWQQLYQNNGLTNGWERTVINLDSYRNSNVKFRWKATTSNGPEGDIAIDLIEFYGQATLGGIDWYYDNDNDGWGTNDNVFSDCTAIPPKYVKKGGDCNDNNPNIHPQITEIGCNGIDENCNGASDDNPSPPTITNLSIKPESCLGDMNGSIQFVLLGTAGPYHILWNDGKTGNPITALPTGIYQATITDNIGCVSTTPFYQVNSDSKITIALRSKTDATCAGRRDGTAEVTVTGGVPPYTYSWPNGQTFARVLGLTDGPVNVTVTDAEGCTKISDTIWIGALEPLVVQSLVSKPISCHGMTDAALSVTTLNGVPPYRYLWENGDTIPQRNQLPPGEYTLSVKDRIGCSVLKKYNIAEPKLLEQKLLSIESIRCFGEKNGKIKTATVGGTAPFKYQWSNNSITDDINNLSAGKFVLTVTDANGCIAVTDTVTITEPPLLSLLVDTITPAKCRLTPDGTIRLTLQGGEPPYEYFWKRLDADGLSVDAVLPGNYSFTAVDNNNCKATNPAINVLFGNQSSPIALSVLQPHLCPDAQDASILATIGSATFPANYNWSSGRVVNVSGLSDTLSAVGQGSFQLTITDAEGCVSTSDRIELGSIPSFMHTIATFKPNACPQDSAGIVGVTLSGGTQPYKYLWSNNKTTPAVGKLPNGMYQVSITDHNSCHYVIGDISMFAISTLSLEVNIKYADIGINNGAISLAISGGMQPYTVAWDDSALMGTQLVDLAPGYYIVTIKDGEGCIITKEIFVDVISAVNDPALHDIDIYPNPTADQVFISGIDGQATYHLFNVVGNLVSTGTLLPVVTNVLDIDHVPPGSYIFHIHQPGRSTICKSLQKIR